MSEDVEIHLRAYDEASDIIQQVGSNLSATFTDIEGRTQDLVTTTDNASSQITDDYNQVNDAGQNLANSQSDVQMSTKDTVMSMNNLALSGASLAMSFMMVENREVAVDRANLMVERSTASLQKAQDEYNKVVLQYGTNSSEAQAALDKLNIAQDAHNVALERADVAQRNLSTSMVMAALTVIPSLVSMITTVSHATEIWEGIQTTMDIVMDANPIFLVVGAIAALIAVLVLVPGALDAVINAFRAAGNFFVGIASDISNAWGGFVGIFTGGAKKVEDSTKAVTEAVQFQTASLKESLTASAAFSMDQQVAAAQSAEAAFKMSSAFTDLRTSMETNYDKMRAAADTNLLAIKDGFDTAFNKGDFDTAIGLVKDFADKYNLSLTDAEGVINSFKAKQAEIPKSIEEQLLGKAQADFQTFQNCISGKAYTLKTDVTGQMSTMAGDITDLIKAGLVGQAQSEMQSYVNCNTDKVATMVTQIETDMTDLTTQHNAQIKQMSDYAATLTDAEKTAVLAQIDAMTTQYEAKMSQLAAWQNELLGTMASDVSDYAGEMASAWAQLEATWGQPGSDILAAIRLGNTALDQAASQTATTSTQITNTIQGLSDTVQLSAKILAHNLVEGSIWTDMLQKMETTTAKSVAKIRAQFQSLQAEGLAGGGFGVPEALPGAGGGKAPIVLHITAPLINIEGSADKATVDLATKQVLDKLKSIVVEPTASYAAATQKRIRQGAVTA